MSSGCSEEQARSRVSFGRSSTQPDVHDFSDEIVTRNVNSIRTTTSFTTCGDVLSPHASVVLEVSPAPKPHGKRQ